ncbi:MAG: hypothetical protein PVS2B2_15390 [Candidatus Acidiferrum sp.]
MGVANPSAELADGIFRRFAGSGESVMRVPKKPGVRGIGAGEDIA